MVRGGVDPHRRAVRGRRLGHRRGDGLRHVAHGHTVHAPGRGRAHGDRGGQPRGGPGDPRGRDLSVARAHRLASRRTARRRQPSGGVAGRGDREHAARAAPQTHRVWPGHGAAHLGRRQAAGRVAHRGHRRHRRLLLHHHLAQRSTRRAAARPGKAAAAELHRRPRRLLRHHQHRLPVAAVGGHERRCAGDPADARRLHRGRAGLQPDRHRHRTASAHPCFPLGRALVVLAGIITIVTS